MVSVVNNGTGSAAQIPGVPVAGKTGTAAARRRRGAARLVHRRSPRRTNPKVAVAVVVENGGAPGNEATGGQVAAPIAEQVMKAVLGK